MARGDFLYGLETEAEPQRTLVSLSGSESGSGAEVWLEAETAKAFLEMQAAAEQDGIAWPSARVIAALSVNSRFGMPKPQGSALYWIKTHSQWMTSARSVMMS